MKELRLVLDGQHFLEGPRWHEGRIWVSDFFARQVVSTDLHGASRVEAELDDRPSGLGWLPDGRLLVVSMVDRKVLRREPSGELVVHADLSALTSADCNDMLVQPQGRAFVSTVGFDASSGEPIKTAPLIRVEPDGTACIAADGIHMPNGLAVIGDLLITAETIGNRLSAFDLDVDGTLSNRRDWARFADRVDSTDLMEIMTQAVVAPDGISADSEGALWVADAMHNRVIRVAAGGEILQEISTGDAGAYSCTLGGPDGRTLFICSAPDFDYAARAEKAEARLLAVTVDVPA